MNTYEIIDRSEDMIQVKLNEEQWRKFQKYLVSQQGQQGTPKKAALKNIIPVMLNKFTKWLDSLNVQDSTIQDMVTFIANKRGVRQNMSIKDLRELCKVEIIKEYWIRFLYDGHAKKSIKQMKLTTNKSLYEKQIELLLREIQNPTIRGQPYKNFISQSKNSVPFHDAQENQNDSTDGIFQENSQFLIFLIRYLLLKVYLLPFKYTLILNDLIKVKTKSNKKIQNIYILIQDQSVYSLGCHHMNLVSQGSPTNSYFSIFRMYFNNEIYSNYEKYSNYYIYNILSWMSVLQTFKIKTLSKVERKIQNYHKLQLKDRTSREYVDIIIFLSIYLIVTFINYIKYLNGLFLKKFILFKIEICLIITTTILLIFFKYYINQVISKFPYIMGNQKRLAMQQLYIVKNFLAIQNIMIKTIDNYLTVGLWKKERIINTLDDCNYQLLDNFILSFELLLYKLYCNVNYF
ncbi:hypothetical protein pb186bvf_016706 [Paramecium bursaria]